MSSSALALAEQLTVASRGRSDIVAVRLDATHGDIAASAGEPLPIVEISALGPARARWLLSRSATSKMLILTSEDSKQSRAYAIRDGKFEEIGRGAAVAPTPEPKQSCDKAESLARSKKPPASASRRS